ncbi:MAG: PIN domain-containing protein [Deltaproteobacteria bacterium]|nr:PIN domain-containing protein [Deltaproteobacteria bacterium]
MYVLDTNILSELFKKKRNSLLMNKLGEIKAEYLFTTSISVMELKFGASLRNDGGELWQRIEKDILSNITILGFHEREAILCGKILAGLKNAGTPVGIEDVMIGSIALAHDFTLVTANIRHFEKIPLLNIENWLS